MNRIRLRVFMLICVVLTLAAFVRHAAAAPSTAVPITLEGVPNLHRVADNFYRSAQPTKEGFLNLEALGIRAVINLRAFHDDDLSGTNMRAISMPMRAWNPETDDILRVMRILSDDDGGPYLVHCQHGADRTGMVTALYRMVFQNWDREDAIREMTEGGFGYHAIWTEIPKFLRRVDIEF
ncbi:MAG: tyrosine-protein phosphatase, partial [Synergistaceae bacterium]|nr:tyrosine-protein phosphatase [Synergistaceae bacterium]